MIISVYKTSGGKESDARHKEGFGKKRKPSGKLQRGDPKSVCRCWELGQPEFNEEAGIRLQPQPRSKVIITATAFPISRHAIYAAVAAAARESLDKIKRGRSPHRPNAPPHNHPPSTCVGDRHDRRPLPGELYRSIKLLAVYFIPGSYFTPPSPSVLIVLAARYCLCLLNTSGRMQRPTLHPGLMHHCTPSFVSTWIPKSLYPPRVPGDPNLYTTFSTWRPKSLYPPRSTWIPKSLYPLRAPGDPNLYTHLEHLETQIFIPTYSTWRYKSVYPPRVPGEPNLYTHLEHLDTQIFTTTYSTWRHKSLPRNPELQPFIPNRRLIKINKSAHRPPWSSSHLIVRGESGPIRRSDRRTDTDTNYRGLTRGHKTYARSHSDHRAWPENECVAPFSLTTNSILDSRNIYMSPLSRALCRQGLLKWLTGTLGV
ncbi:hypothetical protein J6590_012003 [Homalodisca vitripennis]|nr:hypothetical protein J6590_012003 [Homalodisca vitripennis]